MSWQEVERVIGHPDRSAVDRRSRTPGASVELELDHDALPPHSWQLEGMWFISLSVTDSGAADEAQIVDGPEEPPTSICYTGTILHTDILVRLIFFGDVLDCFLVDFRW